MKTMTHDEMVDYYMELIKRHGVKAVVSFLVSIIKQKE